MSRDASVLVVGLLAVVALAPASAQETETTSPLPVLGSSSARFGAGSSGSLAEVARHLRLAGSEGPQALEVNDLNLGQIAAEGQISVTEGNAPVPPPATAKGPQPGEAAVEDWEKRFGEQADAVKKAEERLAAIDQHRSETRDPYQANLGPYSSAPGSVTEGQLQRDEAARALTAESARLDALRKEARRLGVTAPGAR